MPKAMSFAEHISGQLDLVRARQNRIKSKVAELEAAVQLIHPDYTVVVDNDTAEHLADAHIDVVFKGRHFAVDLGLIKHDDIHISDYALELLIDRPVMCEGSPYFKAGLTSLIWDLLNNMTSGTELMFMSQAQVFERRAQVLEILAKITTDVEGAYQLTHRSWLHVNTPIQQLIENTDYRFQCSRRDPIGRIDEYLASKPKDQKIEVRPFEPTLKRIPAIVVFTEVGPGSITRFGLMNK